MITELNGNIIKWIEEHRNDDTTKLRLSCRKKDDATIYDFAIMQIECRKKVAKKLHTTLQSQNFIFPTPLSAEQCTSDDLAEFHSSLINNGENVLDMTAGLGIDAFHLAQKATQVIAIDINKDVAQALSINANALGITNVTGINADSIEYLKSSTTHFNTIFIDPARRGDGGKRLFALADCQPNVVEHLELIKQHCDKLIVKVSPMLDATQVLRELPETTELYAIGTRQECKELVVVLDFKNPTSTPILHCITLSECENRFSFTRHEEAVAKSTFENINTAIYLYEPHPCVMKMQPFNILSHKYNTSKLHPHTHIYSSKNYIPEFPGDCYKIEHIYPFSSRIIKEVAKDYPRANIAVRNFILSAEELRKRLKIKDDNKYRLYGVSIANGDRLLIVTSPI
ncbi:MAG: RsmD family RNA methyltransferase [Muribaculaceae bacterium]|nr:RsmD family RNA methyltransferase [Muribaculaceae bacterium]